jgi:hypothetical protein
VAASSYSLAEPGRLAPVSASIGDTRSGCAGGDHERRPLRLRDELRRRHDLSYAIAVTAASSCSSRSRPRRAAAKRASATRRSAASGATCTRSMRRAAGLRVDGRGRWPTRARGRVRGRPGHGRRDRGELAG